MGYFPVRYDSRVIIYERKMFIRLATGLKRGLNLPRPISLGANRLSLSLIVYQIHSLLSDPNVYLILPIKGLLRTIT